MVWGKGLCVTTTGLDKHDKDAIREDIELAGGRYAAHAGIVQGTPGHAATVACNSLDASTNNSKRCDVAQVLP